MGTCSNCKRGEYVEDTRKAKVTFSDGREGFFKVISCEKCGLTHFFNLAIQMGL